MELMFKAPLDTLKGTGIVIGCISVKNDVTRDTILLKTKLETSRRCCIYQVVGDGMATILLVINLQNNILNLEGRMVLAGEQVFTGAKQEKETNPHQIEASKLLGGSAGEHHRCQSFQDHDGDRALPLAGRILGFPELEGAG